VSCQTMPTSLRFAHSMRRAIRRTAKSPRNHGD